MQGLGGARELASLTNVQVMLMLLVWAPYFESHCSIEIFDQNMKIKITEECIRLAQEFEPNSKIR